MFLNINMMLLKLIHRLVTLLYQFMHILLFRKYIKYFLKLSILGVSMSIKVVLMYYMEFIVDLSNCQSDSNGF
jgi:hypothetical protein